MLNATSGRALFLGEFDEGERWLRRTERALQTDTGPDIRLLLHQTAGMLHAGRGRRREALEEFGAAEHPTEELSPGELRVLRYLPTNLSRPEIAGELSVSPNTVSTHIRSIYAKLQVRDRSSAVQRARELRLLAAGRTR